MKLIYECCKNCPKRGNVCVCDAPTFSGLVEETPTIETNKYVIGTTSDYIEMLSNEIDELAAESIKIYKKALELAVLEGHSKRTFKKRYYRFINQAKEQLKDEN